MPMLKYNRFLLLIISDIVSLSFIYKYQLKITNKSTTKQISAIGYLILLLLMRFAIKLIDTVLRRTFLSVEKSNAKGMTIITIELNMTNPLIILFFLSIFIYMCITNVMLKAYLI